MMMFGQILIQQTAVPDTICDPNRATSTTFSYTHPKGTLYLYVPPVMSDKALRDRVIAGKSLYDAYAETVGVDKLPDFAMRPGIKTALMDKGFYNLTMAKRTCDQYWRCFQEYTAGFQKYPETNLLDRRMQIAPGVFTPSPAEEKCIRETYAKIGSLRDAYNVCGASEIFPYWPGALEYLAIAIAANPTKNLYWAIKAHYTNYILSLPGSPAVTKPVSPGVTKPISPFTIPVSPITIVPEEPEPLDPDYLAVMAELEEMRKSRAQMTTYLMIGGAAVLGFMFLGRRK